jgi:hypothetical protein
VTDKLFAALAAGVQSEPWLAPQLPMYLRALIGPQHSERDVRKAAWTMLRATAAAGRPGRARWLAPPCLRAFGSLRSRVADAHVLSEAARPLAPIGGLKMIALAARPLDAGATGVRVDGLTALFSTDPSRLAVTAATVEARREAVTIVWRIESAIHGFDVVTRHDPLQDSLWFGRVFGLGASESSSVPLAGGSRPDVASLYDALVLTLPGITAGDRPAPRLWR